MKNLVKFYLILAKTDSNGIGYNGTLPWSLRNEMKYFQRMTKDVSIDGNQNAVIMGRRTWESMPDGFKPLSKRLNIVISRTNLELKGAMQCSSLQEVAEKLSTDKSYENIETAWVIGGSVLYEAAIKEGFCDRIYLTNIHHDFPCDTFVNIDVSKGFREVDDPRVPIGVQEENDVTYEFKVYEKL